MDYVKTRYWMFDKHQEPEHGWPRYSDFYITAVAAVFIGIANKAMTLVTWSFFYGVCKEKKIEETRIAKT